MSDRILKIKDRLLDKVDLENNALLEFPLKKTGKLLNNYIRGELIVVGGRKTSGKSSFIFKNYILHPMMEKIRYKKALDVRVFYFGTKKSEDKILEKMITMYTVLKSEEKKSPLKANKLSLSTFYNYPGKDIELTPAKSKQYILAAVNVIDTFIDKNYLKLITGTKSIFEIKNIIKSMFNNYGTFDDDFEDFSYEEEFEEMIPIIIIDDASMILGEDGRNCIKNDNSSKLGVTLKTLAKTLDAIIVLNVPSASIYTSQKEKFYVNKVEEVGAFSNFADKLLFMHNPQETEDRYPLNYEMTDYINVNSGVCYFRMLFVAANSLGPSGIHVPYFFFPQSGNMMELPLPDSYEKLEKYKNVVYNLPTKEKETIKKDEVEDLDND